MSHSHQNAVTSAAVYDRAIEGLLAQFRQVSRLNTDDTRIVLIDRIIHGAKQLDIRQMRQTLRQKFNGTIQRNVFYPPAYNNTEIEGESWADRSFRPLEENERWNYGRRSSNTGIQYHVNENNHPINPFCNYGIDGRGNIGRFGPNHAVDIAPCRVMHNAHGNQTLHVLGIVRGDTNRPAICGGFVEFNWHTDDGYPYSRQLAVTTQQKEMFEEMISGSIDLDPQTIDAIDHKVEQACVRKNEMGRPMSQGGRAVLRRHMITQKKWDHVVQTDPFFLARLKAHISKAGTECYAGPVLGSGRNTNNAWMETRLSWIPFEEEDWHMIQGHQPIYPYRFSAGDDATDVVWHEITPDLLRQSADHAPLFCYVLASYLTAACRSGHPHGRDLLAQGEQIADYLQSPDKSPLASQTLDYSP